MTTKVVSHHLRFKKPSGTSRGILREKPSWFILSEDYNGVKRIGECSVIEGLSPDNTAHIPQVLDDFLTHDKPLPSSFPAVGFGLETWQLSGTHGAAHRLYPSKWLEGNIGIPINGLIWMGPPDVMKDQIKQKIHAGFSCIKMKIGAIDFEEELEIIKGIRREFDADDITLRVDANGAFHPDRAIEKLKRLSAYDIHSIEQPIKPKQWTEMAELCRHSPLPIALDEELIGVTSQAEREQLLQEIQPQYIILKPSLLGGIKASETWIRLAESLGIGWWITSALESNIGLNAIAQWTATLGVDMPQGLGTGGLFTNNVEAPIVIREGHLWYDTSLSWNYAKLGL